MTDPHPDAVCERAAELRSIGVDPKQVVDGRDVEYILGAAGTEQGEAIVCTLTTYRLPDRIAVGDRPDDVVLHALDAAHASRQLGEFADGRPVVLVFGSYT